MPILVENIQFTVILKYGLHPDVLNGSDSSNIRLLLLACFNVSLECYKKGVHKYS